MYLIFNFQKSTMHRMSLIPWIKTGYTENEKTDHYIDGVNHCKTEHQLMKVSLDNLRENAVISILQSMYFMIKIVNNGHYRSKE